MAAEGEELCDVDEPFEWSNKKHKDYGGKSIHRKVVDPLLAILQKIFYIYSRNYPSYVPNMRLVPGTATFSCNMSPSVCRALGLPGTTLIDLAVYILYKCWWVFMQLSN